MPIPTHRSVCVPAALVVLAAGLGAQPALSKSTPGLPAPGPALLASSPALGEVFAGKRLPQNLAELQAIEDHLQKLHARLLPATVFLGGATGVLIEGGLVLTAGHVSRSAGRRITVVLQDGRRLRAESLGLNFGTDTGLLRILDKGEFPSLPIGESRKMATGSWCLMLGFPGGARPGDKPPLRLGRVLRVPSRGYMVTDCCMSAGDSGGPLCDMQGRVIGINSRISRDLARNMHVPVHTFRSEWTALLAKEVKGRNPRARNQRGPSPWLGLEVAPRSRPARVTKVHAGSPAAKAGVKVGDQLLSLAGRRLLSGRSLARRLRTHRAGQVVALRVQREGAAPQVLQATLQRPRQQEKK